MARAKVHLLDVGTQQYGDCILMELGDETVLIDGSHAHDREHIAEQIDDLLDGSKKISLLIVTHAHGDHIGCVPALVENGDIEVEWALVADADIGFGRIPGSDFVPAADESPTDRRVRVLAQALREEDRSDATDDDVSKFLDSVADQERAYRDFIKSLRDRNVKVFQYGTEDPTPLVQRFATIGMRIIGPNQAQIDSAAEAIRNVADATTSMASEAFARDAELDLAGTYRAFVRQVTDATGKRYGAAINMTSIVTMFEYDNRKFLLGGDMEFEEPEPATDEIVAGVEDMRAQIASEAPFDFYKLCHHGSWNGFGENVLGDLGETRNLGICTGRDSFSHPARPTLRLLKQNTDDLRWARTDRNGQTTFSYGTQVRIRQSRGELNNAIMNRRDAMLEEGGPLVPAASAAIAPPVHTPAPPTTTLEPRAADDEVVEVIARVPHTRTRVTLTIDVQPGAGGGPPAAPPPQNERQDAARPRIDVSRGVQGLLFVTSRDRLAQNIGPTADDVIAKLRASGATVLDSLPAGLTHSGEAVPAVRQELIRTNAKGVVILGGYDVVPAQSLDCLPAELRKRLNGSGDPDNFIVWSDDVYGDSRGDALPDVPVSRIPDGRSAQLVATALAAPPSSNGSAGVRNSARPFADGVYAPLPAARPMLQSEPAIFSNPRYVLDTDYVYLMLHGDYSDGSRFWGEETDDDIEAVNISNVPAATGAVVFTGCCWGALTVDKPAGRLVAGQTLGVKTPDSSIALAFLERGARAVVGCTGAHYSPLDEPFDYFGGPIHHEFWSEIRRGTPPAQALFNAKQAYATGMPHGQTSAVARAIEFKMFRQFTCLGLGW